MKLKCKRKKIKNTLYILSTREKVINKSNNLIYCTKKESKFSKGINEAVTSSKMPKNNPRVFHAKTTLTQHFQVVSTSFQYRTHAVYF